MKTTKLLISTGFKVSKVERDISPVQAVTKINLYIMNKKIQNLEIACTSNENKIYLMLKIYSKIVNILLE